MNNQQEMNVSYEFDDYCFQTPDTMIQHNDIPDLIFKSRVDVKTTLILQELREFQAQMMSIQPQNLQRPELKSETNTNTPDEPSKFVTAEIRSNYQEFAEWLLSAYERKLTAANIDALNNISSKEQLTKPQCRLVYGVTLELSKRLDIGEGRAILKKIGKCGYVGG